MRIQLPLLFCLIFGFSFGQTEVVLNIHHQLIDESFAFDQASNNNNNVNFDVGRCEYYLSQFIVVHDGGQESPIADVYALVDAGENTEISLGDVTFTSIEAIKFSVGVDQTANHLNPASYAASHPLAPQNPSMHWGWSAGYRFVAMEGNGGSSLSTPFEIHALGDQNYFEVLVNVEEELINGVAYLDLDADYAAALKDIDVSSGVITHGDFDEAIDLLRNFQNEVFTATPKNQSTGILDKQVEAVSVYPNPSEGNFKLKLSEQSSELSYEIYSAIGKLIASGSLDNRVNQLDLELNQSGMYYLSVFNKEGSQVYRSSLIVK